MFSFFAASRSFSRMSVKMLDTTGAWLDHLFIALGIRIISLRVTLLCDVDGSTGMEGSTVVDGPTAKDTPTGKIRSTDVEGPEDAVGLADVK